MNQVTHYLGGNRRRLGEESTQGLGISQPKRISREGGRFSLIDEAGNISYPSTHSPQLGVYIDVVIVNVNPVKSKIYYDRSKPYDPNSGDPPLCWSDNGIGASVDAIQPQSVLCSNCPMNVRGSAIGRKGQGVTACKDQKKFAVLVFGFPGVWQFTVPAASLSNYRAYAEWLMRQQIPGANRAADVTDVVTRIHYSPGEPNEVSFLVADMGWITPEVAKLQDQLWQSEETDAIVGKHDQPRQGALPAPTEAQPEAATQYRAPQAPLPPASSQAGFGILPGHRPGEGTGPVTPEMSRVIHGSEPRPLAAPSAGFQSTPTAQPQTATVQHAPDASPSNPPRRTRGPSKGKKAERSDDALKLPAFLDRNQPKPGEATVQDDQANFPVQRGPAAAPQQQPQFGMQQATPANPDLSAAVADAFRL